MQHTTIQGNRALLASLALGYLLFIQANMGAAPSAKSPYLSGDFALDPIAVLPAPPDANTQEDRVDRDAAYAVYTVRTPKQMEAGKAQNKLTASSFYSVLGLEIQKGKYPKADALFAQVEREAKDIIAAAEHHWQRPRPAQVDSSKFNDVISKDDSGSYPSDNATRGNLYAMILAEMFPLKRDQLLAKSREMGWLRVQGGVATPLDVYGGRTLGRAMAIRLLRNPAFRKDLEEVRQELAAALTPPAATTPATPAAAPTTAGVSKDPEAGS